MPDFKAIETAISALMREYGYHAVPFAVLSDPAGVPWAWIFLMLLAEEAGKNIVLMLVYGFVSLMIFDHLIYWIGRLGGQKLVHRVCAKRPKWAQMFEQSRGQIQKRGALAVIVGRYLPFIGRWMGLGAGLAGVPFPKFAIYDAIGAALSAFGFGLVAHFVGRKTIEHPYFYQVLVGCIVGATAFAIVGIGIGWWKSRNSDQKV